MIKNCITIGCEISSQQKFFVDQLESGNWAAVGLTVHEVEGIAYGLLQTLFPLLYKAADRYVETLDG